MRPTPKRPRPTTDIPMTAPPEKAMDRALFMPLVRAALAVRTFALVATVMPRKPARTEKSAPTMKHTAVGQLIAKPMTRKNTATKIARILYSDVRNARAPSWMWPEISCILSVPGSAFLTRAARNRAYNRPTRPMAGIR